MSNERWLKGWGCTTRGGSGGVGAETVGRCQLPYIAQRHTGAEVAGRCQLPCIYWRHTSAKAAGNSTRPSPSALAAAPLYAPAATAASPAYRPRTLSHLHTPQKQLQHKRIGPHGSQKHLRHLSHSLHARSQAELLAQSCLSRAQVAAPTTMPGCCRAGVPSMWCKVPVVWLRNAQPLHAVS